MTDMRCVEMEKLEKNQCRYAVASDGRYHLFCGRDCVGSWCDEHRAIVYQPAPPRREVRPRYR